MNHEKGSSENVQGSTSDSLIDFGSGTNDVRERLGNRSFDARRNTCDCSSVYDTSGPRNQEVMENRGRCDVRDTSGSFSCHSCAHENFVVDGKCRSCEKTNCNGRFHLHACFHTNQKCHLQSRGGKSTGKNPTDHGCRYLNVIVKSFYESESSDDEIIDYNNSSSGISNLDVFYSQ
jgi:hypothetical protein